MTHNALALALAWAERGVKVFPLRADKMPLANCSDCRSVEHTPSDCRCRDAGRPCHGFYAATTDPMLLRVLFTRSGAECVGIATGASGLLVVDCDTLKPGMEPPLTWKADGTDKPSGSPVVGTGDLFEGETFCCFQETASQIREGVDVFAAAVAHREERHVETWTVVSPSGGVHYVYAHEDADALSPENRAFPLVDVKTGGSYVVAAGSVTKRGTYRHVRGAWPPAQAPQWLVDHLDRPARHKRAARVVAPRPTSDAVLSFRVVSPDAYMGKVLANAVEGVRNAPLGQVYDTIKRKTYSLAPFVKGGALDLEDVVLHLEAAVPAGAENRIADVRRCLMGALPRVHAERVESVLPPSADDEDFELADLDPDIGAGEPVEADWETQVSDALTVSAGRHPEAHARYLAMLRTVKAAEDYRAAVVAGVASVGDLLETGALKPDAVLEHLVLATEGLSRQDVRVLASEGIRAWRSTDTVC